MHQNAPRVHVHICPGRELCRGNPDSAERRELRERRAAGRNKESRRSAAFFRFAGLIRLDPSSPIPSRPGAEQEIGLPSEK
ncbi:hypothetical protein [Paenibacillus chitinolyticus]|uniref:hypothetical protein n=1 Tax=Paenibacillus chitinolyticus TaxID=79263 RepID=UPI001C451314|nr:hypothetical protein [Paenibacillus chitinolyticus]MBV6715050.1 hypothetical protein [Paenibacillus chitinolyticus]